MFTFWHFALSKMAAFEKNVSGKAMRTFRATKVYNLELHKVFGKTFS